MAAVGSSPFSLRTAIDLKPYKTILHSSNCSFFPGSRLYVHKVTSTGDDDLCICISARHGNPNDRSRGSRVRKGQKPVLDPPREASYSDNDFHNVRESFSGSLALNYSSSNISWRELDSDIILGGIPSELHHVDTISAIGAKALINFQTDEEDCSPFGWEDLSFKAMSLEIVTARLPMDGELDHDQALNLFEAVKVVSSLTATGRKVYLSDSEGSDRASLVALGYMTFWKGYDVTDALKKLLEVVPSAAPSIAAWEQAKTRILTGHASRVAKCAKAIERDRKERNLPGTSAEDWLKAQKVVISELCKEGVETQVSIADAMAQIAVLQSKQLEVRDSIHRERKMPAQGSSLVAKLLFDIAGMEESQIPASGSSEEAAMDAAEMIRTRLSDLRSQLADAKMGEAAAAAEASSVKESMEKLKFRIDNLLRQVVAERSAAAVAEQERAQAMVEAEMLASSLDAERKNISKAKAQAVEQIQELQGQLADMQSKLASAKDRVAEVEKMVEYEKASARATVRNMEQLAKDQERKLEQVIASLRMKIEQAAALYRQELEEVLLEHQQEVEEAEIRHKEELEQAEESYKAALGSLEAGGDPSSVALQLHSAISRNETLSAELAVTQDCMSKMSQELEMLNCKVFEDKMKRDAQVEEELSILRTAQAHVDRMAAEKLQLIQQKSMLQKAILVTLGLALAGPLTVLTMMTSGNVPQVDALELKATQQMIRRIDPSFHERRNEYINGVSSVSVDAPDSPLSAPYISGNGGY